MIDKKDLIRDLEHLPKRLIQLRIEKGWTQRELATKMKMKESQVWRYENTLYQSASLSRIKEFAEVLTEE